MSKAPAIEMNGISFSYANKSVLDNFELSVEEGRIYCLVGSSGSGKTTLLRVMNGLLKPDKGTVNLQGKNFDFSEAEKYRRSMGYSIQGSGLFPHMTLDENLTIIARKEKWTDEKVKNRTIELCQLMGLPSEKSFLSKKPREISGGQQQRVGIARALFLRPQIMLMDEPFSALDPITRSELQKEFLNLQKKLGLTIVLVTHDLSEAFSMADEIILLNKGRIEQKGRPSHFLLSPASAYVREFIESHSPGNILKDIYLYSVVKTHIFVTQEDNSKISLTHLESKESHHFSNRFEASDFLQQHGQSTHYYVDENHRFIKQQNFDEDFFNDTLLSTQNILDGMKGLLTINRPALPVVNDQKQLIGVFSREALDAL